MNFPNNQKTFVLAISWCLGEERVVRDNDEHSEGLVEYPPHVSGGNIFFFFFEALKYNLEFNDDAPNSCVNCTQGTSSHSDQDNFMPTQQPVQDILFGN